MATYEVLYWKEIPAQVKAKDGHDEVSLELSPSFQSLIDLEATRRGLVGTDEYLEGWNWGDEQSRPGGAKEVAEEVKQELEAQFEK